MRREFERRGLPLEGFGWASVQLDGGIDSSIARVQQWFATQPVAGPSVRELRLGLLTIGIVSAAPLEPAVAIAFSALVAAALADGATILVPEGDALVADPVFRAAVLQGVAPHATLAYGEPVRLAGLHLVRTDTDHWVENVTGLAACGAHVIVGAVGDGPQQGHPLVPVVQVAGPVAGGGGGTVAAEDVDHVVSGEGTRELQALRELIVATARRDYQPAAHTGGFVDFQITRGLLGVST